MKTKNKELIYLTEEDCRILGISVAVTKCYRKVTLAGEYSGTCKLKGIRCYVRRKNDGWEIYGVHYLPEELDFGDDILN